MNWDVVAGYWKQAKGKAKQAWAKLAGDGLIYMNGQSDELVGWIQLRYGIQKERAEAAEELGGRHLTISCPPRRPRRRHDRQGFLQPPSPYRPGLKPGRKK
jgi:uncharacterized protein YjbJ (UPF0337 family)